MFLGFYNHQLREVFMETMRSSSNSSTTSPEETLLPSHSHKADTPITAETTALQAIEPPKPPTAPSNWSAIENEGLPRPSRWTSPRPELASGAKRHRGVPHHRLDTTYRVPRNLVDAAERQRMEMPRWRPMGNQVSSTRKCHRPQSWLVVVKAQGKPCSSKAKHGIMGHCPESISPWATLTAR